MVDPLIHNIQEVEEVAVGMTIMDMIDKQVVIGIHLGEGLHMVVAVAVDHLLHETLVVEAPLLQCFVMGTTSTTTDAVGKDNLPCHIQDATSIHRINFFNKSLHFYSVKEESRIVIQFSESIHKKVKN